MIVNSPIELSRKREKIKFVMQKSWNAYKKDAWGYDFLGPQSHSGKDMHGLGYTIVDSLDTLLLMKMYKEFDEATKWINNSFSLNTQVSFFEAVIRCLGGLLSVYEQTHEELFLNNAIKLGDRLLLAFMTPTGLPKSMIDLKTGRGTDHPWAPNISLLADAGSVQLEFLALSIHSGNYTYWEYAARSLKVLMKFGPIPPTQIRNDYLFPASESFSFDSFGDSYFEYLIKLELYSPNNVSFLKQEFLESIMEARKRLTFTSILTKKEYFASISSSLYQHSISHLLFFLPGSLFLASQHYPLYSNEFSILGKSLLNTAVWLYKQTPTHIGGETVQFVQFSPGYYWTEDTYKLRPELIESLFYSWRINKDYNARIVAWKIFEGIKKYCSVDDGFSQVSDTNTNTVIYGDIQESFFLSETLKYLYLMFCDDSVYSLNDYVFTTQAHPLKKRK